MKYGMSLGYRLDGVEGPVHAMVVVEATDPQDAARKVEVALQGLVDSEGSIGVPAHYVDRAREPKSIVVLAEGYDFISKSEQLAKLIRALGEVIGAYDNEREMSIERMADPENAIHEARVDEARKLLALVRP